MIEYLDFSLERSAVFVITHQYPFNHNVFIGGYHFSVQKSPDDPTIIFCNVFRLPAE